MSSGQETWDPHRHTVTSAPAGGGGGLLRVRQLVLVYAPGAAPTSSISLREGPVALGRKPEGAQTFLLPDSEASRTHARLERDDARDVWFAVDCGSRNGLIVDGVKAERAELAPGSVVRLGRSLLVFVETELRPGQRLEPETPALLGHSLAMQRVRGEIALVAPRDLHVLVLGETGVGKERVAEELHRLSGRTGQLIAVNCAAIPEELAESELFGHLPGAFTGATGRSEGLVAAADGGTLFLDEVGELPLPLQAKLLRTLATGEVRPVGGTSPRKVDLRVVAATHRDVERDVAAESFRADLFARLSGWNLRVPPLAARKDDVLRLAAAILAALPHPLALSIGAAEALLLHGWPYNVRELQQVLNAATVRATDGDTLRCEHLPAAVARPVESREHVTRREQDELPLEALVPSHVAPDGEQLQRVLDHFDGNVAMVAQFFRKDRRQIYRWMERHGVGRPTGRDSGGGED